LHRGLIVIPKTGRVGRLAENLNVYDFKMTEEEY
jgi:diketogulonate reductase-like aldo/keto reductase